MDWSPSQMARSPGHWVTSSTCWTSPSMPTTAMNAKALNMMATDSGWARTMATNTAAVTTMYSTSMDQDIALRSLRKRSGLFDNETADTSPEELKSVAQDINQSEKLAGDLDLDFPSQSDWMDLFGGVDCESLVLPVENKPGDPAPVECDLLSFHDGSFDDIEEDLMMENFTDLSNAILGADLTGFPDIPAQETMQEVLPPPVVVSEQPSTSRGTSSASEGRRSLKRKATNWRDTVAVVPSEPLPAAAENHDHDDYTLKIKKPRVSTTSVEDSETESIAESLVSSSAEASTSSGTVDKYTERRKKNNIASRRSRKSRKEKVVAMEDRVENLEQENKVLEEKVAMMEALAKALKQHLVTRLAK